MANFESHPLYPCEALPFFIAAGPLKDGPQLEPFMDIEDTSIIPVLTSGGWTLPEWQGNATSNDPTDFVYYNEQGMAGNARGLPCSGIEGMRKLKDPIKRLTDKGVKTIIQVTNLPQEKPLDVIPIMVEEAADLKPTAVEINLSCPNGLDEDGKLHPPTCNSPDASGEVMYVSRQRVGSEICLGAKDSPHATSLESGVDEGAVHNLVVVIDPYIDFLTGINTIGGQPFAEISCAGGKGGMSGPIVAPVAREWLMIARQVLNADTPILSVGGVDSNNVAEETSWRLEHGAMLVGGSQEFYRSTNPARLAIRWAEAIA